MSYGETRNQEWREARVPETAEFSRHSPHPALGVLTVRGERRVASGMSEIRAEAARILLTVSSHNGMQADDRAYLVRLVAATTGLAPADADHRVMEVVGQAKLDIDRARHTGVLLGFMIGAAALVGAAVRAGL